MNSPASNSVRAPITVATHLKLAILFGLLAGSYQVLWMLAEKVFGWKWYSRVSHDFVWMTPTTDVVFALTISLFFIGLHFILPRRPVLVLALFAYSSLFFLKVLILYGKLDELPRTLLAVGLASQATRFLARRWERVQPVLTRTVVWLSALVLTSTGSVFVSRWITYRQDLARIPPAPADAPNIIVITLDTVRAQNLSLHGYHRRTTPHLEKWAKKGAWFQKALVTAPWTLPSHASMFTGRYPHEMTAHWRTPLDDTHPTLAEALRDRGYLTAGFVANRYYAGYDSGLARGFLHYEDYDHSLGEFIASSSFTRRFFNLRSVRQALDYFKPYGEKSAEEVNSAFLSWLGGQEDRPFFAFLNYFDAHDPYLSPPDPFDDAFGPDLSAEEKVKMSEWWWSPPGDHPKEVIDAAIRAYDASIAYLDQQLDNLFQELERRNLLHKTLIVITSDHGEHFGEHGRYIHGNSLYRQLLHVPLVIIYPEKIPAGTIVKDFVTLRDLPATVMTLLAKDPTSFPGKSLSRFWDSSVPATAESPLFQMAFAIPHPYSRPDHGRSPASTDWILSYFDDTKHYIRYGREGKEEIYDFDADLNDEYNLAEHPEHALLLQTFRGRIASFLADHPGIYADFPPPDERSSKLTASRIDLAVILGCRRCDEE